MRAVLIRVEEAVVYIKDEVFSKIEKGLVIFVGFRRTDTDVCLANMAEKILNLRVFENEAKKLDYSVKDKSYAILCIPNFTLYANTQKGRRPSFEDAMPRQEAFRLFKNFILLLKSKQLKVSEGAFGEHMQIKLVADGPLNIILEEN
ncbi:MAG: D-aminoacyl-tRNA deacylase [Candidatus Omnitrophica bacterium]|nr:D-aminoacyl-tRNA deacylase [Candidatus Omnitrophota bacterium]